MTLKFASKPSKTVNWLRDKPIAHRGLHDETANIWENSLSAARASISHGYPIELDLQPSADRVPMVFHDEELARMTGINGNIREINANALRKINIRGTADHIPTLVEFLDLVSGDVGVVIELKGKTGADGGFVEGVLRALEGYHGDYALMSFEHHILGDFRAFAPDQAVGLTAFGEDRSYETHREITDKAMPDFLSYDVNSLETRFVSEFRASGRPVICWTVKSREQEEYAMQHCDQPTFENYLA